MVLAAHYDYIFVLLSFALAICGAHVSLSIAQGINHSAGKHRTWRIFGGAFVMGVAVWSMHFVGMLAFRLPVTVRYDLWLVVLSGVVAVLAFAVAFVLTGAPHLEPVRLTFGALAMGSGIALMHYIGMAAMRMPCAISWNPEIVVISVIIGVVASGFAMASFRASAGYNTVGKLNAAAWLGTAIGSMHYVGMSAAHFVPTMDSAPDFRGTIGGSLLGAAGIAGVCLALLALARGGDLLGAYIDDQSKRLHSSEQRYRVLFEKSLVGIYRALPDGSVLDMNEAGLRLLGYASKDELRNVNRHLVGLDSNAFANLGKGHRDLPAQELQLVRGDGASACVLHSAAEIDFPASADREIHGFFLSIDALKQSEAQLRQAQLLAEAGNLAKRQFMTKMSHELRTPLNGILGMANLLADLTQSVQQREYLGMIKECGEQLLDSINEILLYTDESSPRVESHWEEFALRDLIKGEIHAIEPGARRKGLALCCEIAPAVAERYFSDTKRLRQILSALLSNALKFTPQGQIEVVAHSRPSSVAAYPIVSIAVADSGVGIAREQQRTIFEPFASIASLEHRGTGLGLATVKNCVSALHGTISVESELGHGSIFKIELPLRPTWPLQA